MAGPTLLLPIAVGDGPLHIAITRRPIRKSVQLQRQEEEEKRKKSPKRKATASTQFKPPRKLQKLDEGRKEPEGTFDDFEDSEEEAMVYTHLCVMMFDNDEDADVYFNS
jgi:hypothetical protein